MADTAARSDAMPSLRREAILEAVAYTAERLLLTPDWRQAADEVLARLGQATGVSRSYIMENTVGPEGRLTASVVFEWNAPGVEPQIGNPFVVDAPWDDGFQRWADAHARGEALASRIRDLPEGERPELERQGILSILEYPVFVGDGWWGCIGFDDCVTERVWSAADIDGIRAASTVLAAAVWRRRSDEHLYQAEERYRTFVELIPAVTYTDVPQDGRMGMGFVSPQIGALLGHEPKGFIQDPTMWFSLIHPEDRARLDARGAFDPLDESPFDDEYRMKAVDGTWVWVHDTSTPVRGADGSISYYLGFMTDITPRKRTEERLRRAEDRFRLLIEQMPAVTYTHTVDASGVRPVAMDYMGPQVESLSGHPVEAWLGMANFYVQVVHPDDLVRLREAIVRSSSDGSPMAIDYRIVRPDSHIVWVHEEALLIRGIPGRAAYWQGFMLDITERKGAETQLRQAEERFRALVEHLPAIVYAQGLIPETDELYLSPQVQAILGYSNAEFRSTLDFWRDHLHPDDRERALAESRRTDQTGEAYVDEYRLRAADGSYRWIHDEAALVLDEGGTPLYWQGAMFDITERRAAEEELHKAEDRYRAVVENIPAVIYVESLDADPERFFLSPQVESMFGYTVQEWTWTPGFWLDHVHPDDRARVVAIDAASNGSHDAFSMEYRFQVADGRWIWIHDEATYVSGPDDHFWQGFMLDVTARKEAETQLRSTEEQFRSMVEQNQAVFYIQEIDPVTQISRTTYVAPGHTDLAGYTTEQVQEDPELWLRIVHPEDRERIRNEDRESNAGEVGEQISMEYRIIHRDGRVVWVQDEARLVQIGDEPPHWQGFLLDVTRRKDVEEQLAHALEVERDATQQLRALDEMKNTFLQAVSHDLRTPLAAILGLAITLERSEVELSEDDARDLARRIADNSRRLDRLVTNLLDLDRLTRGIIAPKLHNADVGALVRRLLAESELIAGSRLQTDIQPVVIPIDSAKVERIVENLLANTVRHTPSNATIWVSVAPADGGALVKIEDDGPGVAPELREVIFEPFQQGPDAPQHSPGVGVGLTLVRRFAELHNGRAWVEEREGGGASFRVFLPLDQPAPPKTSTGLE